MPSRACGRALGLQAWSRWALKSLEPLPSGGRGCRGWGCEGRGCRGRAGLEPSGRMPLRRKLSFNRCSCSIVNKIEGTRDICLFAIKKSPKN